jgi:hypothetical protein
LTSQVGASPKNDLCQPKDITQCTEQTKVFWESQPNKGSNHVGPFKRVTQVQGKYLFDHCFVADTLFSTVLLSLGLFVEYWVYV